MRLIFVWNKLQLIILLNGCRFSFSSLFVCHPPFIQFEVEVTKIRRKEKTIRYFCYHREICVCSLINIFCASQQTYEAHNIQSTNFFFIELGDDQNTRKTQNSKESGWKWYGQNAFVLWPAKKNGFWFMFNFYLNFTAQQRWPQDDHSIGIPTSSTAQLCFE